MASPLALFRHLGRAIRAIWRGEGRQLYFLLRNRLSGVDLEHVSVDDLGLSPEVAHFHSHSGGDTLRAVFATIPVPVGSVALDLGSGKGGATISLHHFPFSEIRGVELSERLVAVARQNMARLKLTRARFIVGDAAAYHDLDAVTHIYMYNPFPCAVMVGVLRNLEQSLIAAPRHVLIVYRNAICHELLAEATFLTAVSRFSRDGHEWRIYQSREAGVAEETGPV